MKKTIFIIGLLVLNTATFGQSTKSVIKLKNGVVLRGEIFEFIKDEHILIHLMDDYDMKIPFEEIRAFKIKDGKMKEFKVPEPGYFNYTSTGLLFLKQSRYGGVSGNMTIHTINGYRLNKFYSTGLGVGLDRYGTTSALPVYVSIRRDLYASRVTPMFNANMGYGWMWENENYNDWDDFDEVKGGIFWELGAGLRINYKKTALVFNYTYKRQNSKLSYANQDWWRLEDTMVENHKFRNMTLTVGMEF